MHRLTTWLFTVCVFACIGVAEGWAAAPGPAPQWAPDAIGGYASTHVIVRVVPQALAQPPGAQAPPVAGIPGMPAGVSGGFRAAARAWGVRRIRPLYPYAFAFPDTAARHGLDRTFILDVPGGTDTPRMAAALRQVRADVEIASLDVIGTVAEFEPVFPDDPRFCDQYALYNPGETCSGSSAGVAGADIKATEAWAIHTGHPGTVTVAIIDSGVTPDTVELAGRLVPGISTVTNSEGELIDPDDTTDQCNHGTGVASVVAANTDNATGMAGVSWGANIMPVRVLPGCGGKVSHTAAGIIWAVDNGADILNISLQFNLDLPGITEKDIQIFKDSINYAHDNNRLVVSAAGNDNFCGSGVVCAPASFMNSMAICATNRSDRRASFSNTGPELDVCAPGDQILALRNNELCDVPPCLSSFTGTSFAAPHVSGLAALIRSLNPSLTADQLRAMITTTPDDIESPGFDTLTGHGRIHSYKALLSYPPAGAIDARQPFHPDGADPDGWQWLDLNFLADFPVADPFDFFLVQEGGVSGAPTVVSVDVSPDHPPAQRVSFSSAVSVGAWLTLIHLETETAVRVGNLPGDVNGDGVVTPEADVTALRNVLTSTVGRLPDFSTDIDRSEATVPADLLRLIDIINRAEMYETLTGIDSLPDCTPPDCF